MNAKKTQRDAARAKRVIKRRAAIERKGAAVPEALRIFDSLPDSAFVRLRVVTLLFSYSVPTVWRRVKSGDLPKPVRLGERHTAWNVGLLRQKLQAMAAGAGGAK